MSAAHENITADLCLLSYMIECCQTEKFGPGAILLPTSRQWFDAAYLNHLLLYSSTAAVRGTDY